MINKYPHKSLLFTIWQKRETMLPTKLSLVLLMMVAVNFSLANPVKNNVEEDYDMNNAMEGNYKFTRSAEFIDEEDSKKASWETSRYFFNEIAPLQSLMILKIGERSCTPSSCPLSLASLALTGSTSVSPGSADNRRKMSQTLWSHDSQWSLHSETYIVIGVIKLVACGIGGVVCGLAACDCRVNIKNAKVTLFKRSMSWEVGEPNRNQPISSVIDASGHGGPAGWPPRFRLVACRLG